MESLALLATLIVLPAMFGGPIALLLTYFRITESSRVRKLLIIIISILSIISGIFLALGTISRGATVIGLIGFITGFFAVWRVRSKTRPDS